MKYNENMTKKEIKYFFCPYVYITLSYIVHKVYQAENTC